jgi:hypothetical protein
MIRNVVVAAKETLRLPVSLTCGGLQGFCLPLTSPWALIGGFVVELARLWVTTIRAVPGTNEPSFTRSATQAGKGTFLARTADDVEKELGRYLVRAPPYSDMHDQY